MATWLIAGALGFFVGVVALYIYKVRQGPALQPWHTVMLTEEFARKRSGGIRTLDDYLALEDRLFAQLDEEVFARTGTGAGYELVRYSTGSAADPHRRTPDWNRTFELPADPARGGVLLLHGMSDSPYSLRAIGESLQGRGYHVVGLRMPGHGTAPSGLTSIRWEDMAAAVRLGMEHLASKAGPSPLHVIGYSTGAPLAIDYVLETAGDPEAPKPASLVLLSPAIGVSPAAALAGWVRLAARVPGLEKMAWTAILPEFDPYKYNSFAVNAGEQVHRITHSIARRVEERAGKGSIDDFPPTLLFLSTVDATVSADAVIDNLLEHLAAGRHEMVLFDINRNRIKTSVLVSDPGPLTTRLMADTTLPFRLTLITNETPDTDAVVSRSKAEFSSEVTTEPLGLGWPRGVISLSHIALPFPPEDPLYGVRSSRREDQIYLGQIEIQGERGLLQVPSDWLLRLRHNPFYDYLEERVVEWVEGAD